MRWMTSIIDRMLGVAGALLFTQIPLFFQQYLQRLAGHVSELELQLTLLKQTAAKSGKTLTAYIDKFLQQSDQDFVTQGEYLKGMVDRLGNLQQSYATLSEATVWTQPLEFLRFGDQEIFWSTIKQFEPGFSFSAESAVYAFIGMALGVGIFKLFRRILLLFSRGVKNVFRPAAQ